MKKKRISSLLLSLIILSSSISGLTVTSSAVEPVNRVTQSYKNTEYASYIVPADTIPSGSGYQQVEYIASQGGNSFTIDSGHSLNSAVFSGFGTGNMISTFGYSNLNFVLVRTGTWNEYFYNSTLGSYSNLSLYFNSDNITGSYYSGSSLTSNTLASERHVDRYFSVNFNSIVAPSSNINISSYNSLEPVQINFNDVSSGSGSFVLKANYRFLDTSDSYTYGTFNFNFTSPKGGSTSLGNINILDSSSSGQVFFNFSSDGYNLIPCYRLSDGLIGLYDSSNDKFYLPSTSDLTKLYAGPDVTGVTEPTIIDQSSDYTLYLTGSNPELYVNATTEIGNLTYQWQRSNPSPLGYSEWADIENATEQFYTPPAFDDLGIYKFRCKVGSVLGSSGLYIYSDVINIEVVEADPDIPVIVSQPDSKVYYDTIQHLDHLTIEVAPMEEGQITYQWQYRDDNNIWRDIQGATSDTLNVDNRATHIGSYYYRCNVSNTLANVTKNVTSNEVEIKIIKYNSFEDFWQAFFNNGLGSINSIHTGLDALGPDIILPTPNQNFAAFMRDFYQKVVPDWFARYVTILLWVLCVVAIVRGVFI